jgi:hypothetical protein
MSRTFALVQPLLHRVWPLLRPMPATFAVTAVLCVSGCTGTIGEAAPGDQSPQRPGPNGDPNVPGTVGGPPTTIPTNPQTPIDPRITGTDPGRVTIHRLNKTEYNNTVRDLLGTTLKPADEFPPDFQGAGFDNVAESLALSPIQLSLYQKAAEALVEDAFKPGAGKFANLGCSLADDTCLRTTIRNFAKRAWRRPVTDTELDRYYGLAALAKTKSDPPEVGLKLAAEALLMSPNFLFRVELDPDPNSTALRLLNDHEIASRLSYFLWSTMPDETLFSLADAGSLRSPAMLAAQVTRMLKDQKASALISNFAGQWLFSRAVDDLKPDPVLFPKFDAPLKAAMRQETELLFKEIAFTGAPATELLSAKYTFLNDRLAQHYGLPAVGSTELKKTMVEAKRGGYLGHASVLTFTSHPTSTSPVLRGVWVLGDLLCTPVPPPPPTVDTALATSMTGATLRERMESHRNNPLCSSCHKLMDPIGFGFENYDAVGAYRTTEGGRDIDASGEYLDGTKFSGLRELADKLVADPKFAACMTEKLYTYALGRSPVTTGGHMDPSTIEVLTAGFKKGGFKFESLVQNMVATDTFLKRRGEGSAP